MSTTGSDEVLLVASRFGPRAKVALAIGSTALFMIALPSSVYIIWAVVAALSKLALRRFGALLDAQYDAVWRFIAGLDPEPEPTVAEKIATHIKEIVIRIDSTLVSILLVGIVTMISLWLLSGYVIYLLRRVAYRVQGIQFEAMRPGSSFVKGEIPKYQVEVAVPGILIHSHQGYGVRLGKNYLAIPRHVLDNLTEVILIGPLGKVCVPAMFVKSRVHPDLAYMFLEEKLWTTLGVKKCSLAPHATSVFAQCAGKSGVSRGRVYKSSIEGMLVYEGSTEPGMSGAAYEAAGTVVGIHTGVVGNVNMGVSAVLLGREYQALTRVESRRPDPGYGSGDTPDDHGWDLTGDMNEPSRRPHITNSNLSNLEERIRTAWDTDKVMKRVDSAYDKSWLGDDELDYNAKLDFGESARYVKQGAIPKRPTTRPVNAILVEHQGDDATTGVYTLTSVDLEMRVAKLEAEVAALKANQCVRFECDECPAIASSQERLDKHKEHSHVKKVVEKFPCPKCGVLCTTEEKLKAHTASAHPEPKVAQWKCQLCGSAHWTEQKLKNHIENQHRTVIAEGEAATGNSRVVVKTDGHFLEKRSRSAKRRQKESSTISSKLGSKPKSPSLEEVLSLMMASLKGIETRLSVQQKDTGGLSSAIELNSKPSQTFAAAVKG